MYYDRLKARVKTAVAVKEAQKADRIDILDLIAPCYHPLHNEVMTGAYTTFHLPGGRGSCKSSFVSLEMVNGVMNDPKANGIVFRRVAGTMRESVYSQIAWAVEELGVSALWRGSVSPMQFTYKPTGQQILFRGLDDSAKLNDSVWHIIGSANWPRAPGYRSRKNYKSEVDFLVDWCEKRFEWLDRIFME